jgi:hypothetical protein
MKNPLIPSGKDSSLFSIISNIGKGNYINYKGKIGRDGHGTPTHIIETDVLKQKDQILKNGKRKRTMWEK